MEGVPDIMPEKIIEAPTKELAVYIYELMFRASTSIDDMKKIISRKGYNISFQTFATFLNKDDINKYWGISIEEVE